MASKPAPQETVYVYEAPVRLWHWINAFAILALCVTGYLIGKPLPAIGGEPYDHFLFGKIRFIHFASGQILVVSFALRVYWAFVGNIHARELFHVPVTRAPFWKEVFYELKCYMLMKKSTRTYAGHNPLAQVSIHLLFVWTIVFMMVTGLALYGEGEGPGLIHRLFTSWVIPLFGASQNVHTWHHLGMWVMISFIIVHIYAAVRDDILSRHSSISSMISGWKTFKGDDRPR